MRRTGYAGSMHDGHVPALAGVTDSQDTAHQARDHFDDAVSRLNDSTGDPRHSAQGVVGRQQLERVDTDAAPVHIAPTEGGAGNTTILAKHDGSSFALESDALPTAHLLRDSSSGEVKAQPHSHGETAALSQVSHCGFAVTCATSAGQRAITLPVKRPRRGRPQRSSTSTLQRYCIFSSV